VRPQLDIEQIKATLIASELIASWRILVADETTERALYKIRCRLLRPAYQLEIRLIQTGEEIIYSYQLFHDQPLLRWDNAPHFPSITNFPHHWHDESGQVNASPLTGSPEQDLSQVLTEVRDFLTKPVE
jgi:hypothetical protein